MKVKSVPEMLRRVLVLVLVFVRVCSVVGDLDGAIALPAINAYFDCSIEEPQAGSKERSLVANRAFKKRIRFLKETLDKDSQALSTFAHVASANLKSWRCCSSRAHQGRG